jgi:hypothetical protein
MKLSPKIIQLDPIFQKEVVDYWFQDQPLRKKDYSEEILMNFKNTMWILANSNGSYQVFS